MLDANASRITLDQIPLSLKAAAFAAVTGAFALGILGLAHSVVPPASDPGERTGSPNGPTDHAAAPDEPHYFPARFRTPEGESAEPIATF